VVRTLRAAAPDLHFNLQMITRDPLQVPCVTSRYWETFPDLPGRHLARPLRRSSATTCQAAPYRGSTPFRLKCSSEQRMRT